MTTRHEPVQVPERMPANSVGDSSDEQASPESPELTVRPAPFRKARAYRLAGEVLHWTLASRSYHLRLADIKSIRVHMPGDSLELTSRCVMTDRSGKKYDIGDRHWFEPGMRPPGSPRRFERRTSGFVTLVQSIVSRLETINPDVQFVKGPGWIEWGFSALAGVAGVAIFMTGAYFMLSQGVWDIAAIAFMLMVVAYMPFLWPIIRSGGPKRVSPRELGVVLGRRPEGGPGESTGR